MFDVAPYRTQRYFAQAQKLVSAYGLTGRQAIWACYQTHQPSDVDLDTLLALADALDADQAAATVQEVVHTEAYREEQEARGGFAALICSSEWRMKREL